MQRQIETICEVSSEKLEAVRRTRGYSEDCRRLPKTNTKVRAVLPLLVPGPKS